MSAKIIDFVKVERPPIIFKCNFCKRQLEQTEKMLHNASNGATICVPCLKQAKKRGEEE